MTRILQWDVPHELKAETTSGQTSNLAPAASNFSAAIHCSAATALTSLVVDVEWSTDGTNWFAASDPGADTATISSAPGYAAISGTVEGAFCRIKWTLTGTSATFRVTIAWW